MENILFFIAISVDLSSGIYAVDLGTYERVQIDEWAYHKQWLFVERA
jgi:hypothetical protein